jgi:glutamate dehydrogenase
MTGPRKIRPATDSTAGVGWEALVAADREQFDRVAGSDGKWEFPGRRATWAIALEQPEVRIGRRTKHARPAIDLTFPGPLGDPASSRLHAFLQRRADGTYALVDNGSLNGTTLNADPQPIEKYVPIPLTDGDRIHLGAWTTITIHRVGLSYGTSEEEISKRTDRVRLEGGAASAATSERPVSWLVCAMIADSRLLRQRSPDRYRSALDTFRHVITEIATEFRGAPIRSVEDRMALAFSGPAEAFSAAIAASRRLHSESDVESIPVRIAVHAESSDGARVSTRVGFAVCLAAHPNQVLVSESANERLTPELLDEFSVRELGSFRLTDLLGPSRVFQLDDPSAAREFPPPRSLDARPHNLPMQFTRFIGRDAEVEEVKQLVLANRLCSVTGTGGAGKSRLALEVAAGVALYTTDGVWFADLSGVADSSLVATSVAGALGLREGGSGTYAATARTGAPSPTERLVEYLQNRNALIVLDNCERVIGAVVELTDALLRDCPTVRVLVTSRQALGLPGEVRFRLGPLELPSPRLPTSALRQCASVRLFIDRALLQDAARSFSDAEIEIIAAICERIDGIPFAIELAAAQTRFLTVSQIAELLEDRMLSLEATIEWSVERLSDAERVLLRRLSVFAGEFMLEAAENICGGHGLDPSEMPGLLRGLVDQSLVEIATDPEANRYRLLEATRQYGARELEASDEHQWLAAAHAAWYARFAEQAAAELTGAKQRAWLDALERDEANLRSALLAAAQLDTRGDLRLAGALSRFWIVRGLLSEGSAWIESALRRSPLPADGVRLEALCAGAMLACFASVFDHAERLSNEALDLARTLGAGAFEAQSLTMLGLVENAKGNLEEAARLHADALRIAERADDWWVLSFVQTNLGNAFAMRGAVDEARACYEDGLALRREHQDAWGMFWTLFRLGVLTSWEGRSTEAVSLLEESFATARDLRYGQGTLLALLGLGDALRADGSLVPAGHRYAEALRTARDLEEPASACLAIAGLAEVALARSDIVEAAKWLTQEETLQADRSPAVMATVQGARARLADAEGDVATAESVYRQAIATRRALGDRRGVLEEAEFLALAWSRAGRLREAAAVLGSASTTRRDLHLPVTPAAEAALGPLMERVTGSTDADVTRAWNEGREAPLDETLRRLEILGGPGVEAATPAATTQDRPTDADERLAESRTVWIEEVCGALTAGATQEAASELIGRYRDAFPTSYWVDTAPDVAARDIEFMEASDGDLTVRLEVPIGAPEGFLELKLLHAGDPISISEIAPILERMGVRVLHERICPVSPVGSVPLLLYRFGLTCAGPVAPPSDEGVLRAFEEAFTHVWRGELENDSLNQLSLGAGCTWRDVSLLRAYTHYASQIRQAFSTEHAEQTLAAHPAVARLLLAIFHGRFDPDAPRQGVEDLVADALTSIDLVTSLDEDRILRWILQLVRATVRTNFFQLVGGAPKDRIVFKFDPAAVPDLPPPQPMHEIFVYSPRTEGVHLRGGAIARGGIRWSDRLRDYRTEVAGLMKAQTLKNAVIVPVGAKGGFVVRHRPADSAELEREVRDCYRAFISGLLDVTDNQVDGLVVPPERVVRYDGDDTYLVVAADKGTATFSDLANEISAEYGFWLGDAFASGGSNGYDHKEMAITARGAWESAKSHFHKLGIDADEAELTVVGIGDMSGDVFGNGALRSRKLRLVGAFDHRHILLDPDPDPARSFAERQRLFALPRSSWADYSSEVLSPGGGVFARDAKSVVLSPEAQKLLGTDQGMLTPDEVIRALMTCPVDLIYNGGIGTFVKATAENDDDVGDRANDQIRIDASQLRCRVVVEGGNLGMTQRARVEFARRGGLVNSDAIDNSGGVDCSDHEVNLKILLAQPLREGRISEEERNELLADMSEEVAALVLRDNYLQNQALVRNARWSEGLGPSRLLAMESLELSGNLDRDEDALPSDSEFNERRSAGEDLSVPELAVLLAHAKIALYEELLSSTAPDYPEVAAELERYFPTRVMPAHVDAMRTHPLRRAIIANSLANDLLNHMEVTFSYRLQSQTEKSPTDVGLAFVAAREILEMRSFWTQVEVLDSRVSTETQAELMRCGNETIERLSRWLLRRSSSPLDVTGWIDRYAEPIATVVSALPTILVQADRDRYAERVRELTDAGVPKELFQPVAGWRALLAAPDIAELSLASGEPVEAVGSLYFTLGQSLELAWLHDQIDERGFATEWEMRALFGYKDELFDEHREMTAIVLAGTSGERSPEERTDEWIGANAQVVDHWRSFATRIQAMGAVDVVTLGVAVRELHNLVETVGKTVGTAGA